MTVVGLSFKLPRKAKQRNQGNQPLCTQRAQSQEWNQTFAWFSEALLQGNLEKIFGSCCVNDPALQVHERLISLPGKDENSFNGSSFGSSGGTSTTATDPNLAESQPVSEGRSHDAPALPAAFGTSSSANSYERPLPCTASMDCVKSPVVVRPITSAELSATTERIASNVVAWSPDSFTRVKLLQDAVRNHGWVDLMCRKDNGRQVVVKRMPTTWVTSGPNQFKETYPTSSELPWSDIGLVGHLNSIKYPYACDLFGVYTDQLNTFVVSEFATEGDLFGWCEDGPLPGPQREAMMLPLAKQILTAVKWLHNLGIAHRDLSLENILLTDVGGGEMRIKLIDFGMATLSKSSVSETAGKASYQAPEMHGNAPCDQMAFDHFALGVVLFALASQDYPWTATTPNSCRLFAYMKEFGLRKLLKNRQVRKGPTKCLSDVFSLDFVELIEGMLAFDPAERSTLDEICYASGPKANMSITSAKWLMRQ